MDGNTYERLLAVFHDTPVDLIFDEEASGCDDMERKSWTQIFGLLQIIFPAMSQHKDISEEQLDALEEDIDSFSQLWMSLTGGDKLANYIHMFLNGHIMYYLRIWNNF
jgi:hypothetical protein